MQKNIKIITKNLGGNINMNIAIIIAGGIGSRMGQDYQNNLLMCTINQF